MSIEQETYNNMRTRWLTTTTDSEAITQLNLMADYKKEHPEVKNTKVYFN